MAIVYLVFQIDYDIYFSYFS